MNITPRIDLFSSFRDRVGDAVKPGPPADPLDQIEKLGKLRDSGLVTQEEFEAKKADLLARL
jgi:hypothetical protein